MTDIAPEWNPLLLDQLEFHWTHGLRPRLEGLTDDEYFWEPVAGSWNLHPRGHSTAPIQAGAGAFTLDYAFPEPDPAPLTTIAWRIGHILVGCLAMRSASHFGKPATDYESWTYAPTAKEALEQLDEQYAVWCEGVRSLGEDGLSRPCGPAEGPFAEHSLAALVLHINREVIHHGAEICLLRDLHLHTHRLDS